jgi:hypothetical protein
MVATQQYCDAVNKPLTHKTLYNIKNNINAVDSREGLKTSVARDSL